MKPFHPNIISFVYIDGPKTLQLSSDDIVFWVDGIDRSFKSPHSSALLGLIAEYYPNSLSFEEIYQFFLNKFSIGSFYNVEAGVHKIVHALRQDLQLAGLRMELLKNIRGRGYRLSDGWKIEAKINAQFFVQKELETIRNLVFRCIRYVNEREILATPSNLYYLDHEPHVTQENFMILDRIGWQLIHSINDPKLVPEILDIKRSLSNLSTYVVFWRVGHRITPDLWREDFECEIRKILSDLELGIAKIQHRLNNSNLTNLLNFEPLFAQKVKPEESPLSN